MPTPLAFIGLGIMGFPMAGHLLAAGHALTVYSRTKSKADELLAKGATWADSPADAAAAAEVVFVCVTDTPDVEDVIAGERGLLHGARRGAVVVDHSTISPSATRRLCEHLAWYGIDVSVDDIAKSDLGRKLRVLGLVLDSPDAESGMLLVPPFAVVDTLAGGKAS